MSAGASEVRAGGAYVELGTRDSMLRRGLAAAASRLKAFGNQVNALGRSMVYAGTAMAAPMVAAARTFASFTDQMAIVRAVTSASDKEFAALTDTAKRLGETTSFTASEVASAMVALGRAGFTTDEILSSVAGTLDLARAGALDLGQATTIMADISRSFGMAADQAGRVGDIIAKAANISNTTVGMLGESMTYVASAASLSGQKIERVSAALAVLANRGIKGSMAGTSMAMAMTKLVSPENKKKLDAMGISVMDQAGNMRDLSAILREIGARTAAMGSGEKLALFRDLFDQRGMRSMSILAENIDQWEELTGVIENSGGTAARIAKQMDDNLGGSWRIMMSGVEGLQLSIGKALDGILRKWMAVIGAFVASGIKWVESNRKAVVSFFKVVVAIIATGTALVALGTTIKMVGAMLGFLASTSGIVIVSLMAIGVAALMLLDYFGIIDVGFNNLMNSIQVQGSSIGAWMRAAWLEAFNAWSWFEQAMGQGLDFVALMAVRTSNVIRDAFWDALGSVRDAVKRLYIEMQDVMNFWAGGGGDAMVRGQQEVRKQADKLFGKGAVGATPEDRAKRDADIEMRYATMRAKRAAESDAQRQAFKDAQSNVFKQDMGKAGFTENLSAMIQLLKSKMGKAVGEAMGPEFIKDLEARLAAIGSSIGDVTKTKGGAGAAGVAGGAAGQVAIGNASVAGSFGGVGLKGMGVSGDAIDRTAKNTAALPDMAKTLEEIEQNTASTGLTFGY